MSPRHRPFCCDDATDYPIPPNVQVIIPLEVNQGDVKVSAIQSAAGGNLLVQPLAY